MMSHFAIGVDYFDPTPSVCRCLALGGTLSFYLPGPAVRFDILAVNHPGHRRGKGGLATPVRCGRHKLYP